MPDTSGLVTTALLNKRISEVRMKYQTQPV